MCLRTATTFAGCFANKPSDSIRQKEAFCLLSPCHRLAVFVPHPSALVPYRHTAVAENNLPGYVACLLARKKVTQSSF